MKVRKGRAWRPAAITLAAVVLLGGSMARGAGLSGALDTTFDGDGIVRTAGVLNLSDVAIQPIHGSERYLVAGLAAAANPTPNFSDLVVLAYTTSGALDPTFGAGGDGTYRLHGTDSTAAYAYGLSLDGQNRILVVGTSAVRTVPDRGESDEPAKTKRYRGLTIVRLTPDGRPDTNFNGTGVATVWAGSPDGFHEEGVGAVAIPPSLGGGILAGGVCYSVDAPAKGSTPALITRHTFFAKFRDDGTLDTTFGTKGIAHDPRSGSPLRGSVRLQRDGKIVVGQRLDFSPAVPDSSANTATSDWAVSRFTSTGTLDTTFGSGGRVIVGGARVRMVTVNATNDSILAVGDGSVAGGDGLVARYLANGAPDATFDGDGYAAITGWVNGPGDVALQLDGRVMVCGQGLVGRFTTGGSPDASFGGTGYAPLLPNGWSALAIAEASDGLVVAGTAGFVARYGKASDPAELERMLGFEGSRAGAIQPGWTGGPPGHLFADDKIVHGGAWSGRIERPAGSGRGGSGFTAFFPMNFAGTTLELRGFLRTEGVTDRAGLWLGEFNESGMIAYADMKDRAVHGTTEWTQYAVRLPIDRFALTLSIGAHVWGEGKVWVDDLELLVDGKPIQQVPKAGRLRSALETDREFDAGSKVTIDALTPVQTASLAMLGKVWGFLKYHHPKVVAGAFHWDYELFRVLPAVLAAPDPAGAQSRILSWAQNLGDVAPCDPCASLPEGLALRPDLDWIHDRPTLGEPLAAFLENVYRNRPAHVAQEYVALRMGVRNPEFRREKTYKESAFPDPGYRILALLRWWSVVQYWSPNRDVIGADWNAVLPEFLPRMVAATDVDRYRLEMLALISRLNDGHASLGGAIQVQPPRGDCQIPVRLRFVEGKPVVVGYMHAEQGPATGLKVGDALLALDGVPIDRLIATWTPYYSASNDAARMDAMMPMMTRGKCGPVKVGIERSGVPLEVATERGPGSGLDLMGGRTHDLPGPAFRRLSPEVAYLKLSAVKNAEMPEYVRGAEGSKGWIIDIRNYPSDFVVFTLGGHFVSEPRPFVRFTTGDTANPGAFHWQEPPYSLTPIVPHYPGKVVILVDEVSVSNAEYTAMAFRAAPNAIVVGSTTAGADGNVSGVPLPGGLESMISGIGVFYPDKKPTQRVGIVPDVEVRPTIAGIRDGRDEVLEAAVRQVLGADVSLERIQELVGR